MHAQSLPPPDSGAQSSPSSVVMSPLRNTKTCTTPELNMLVVKSTLTVAGRRRQTPRPQARPPTRPRSTTVPAQALPEPLPLT